MKTKLVVKDNTLIDAAFHLSLVEQRLMLLGIVYARELDLLTSETPVEVPVNSYIESFGTNGTSTYAVLKKSARTLKSRNFTFLDTYDGEEAVTISGWVNEITYVENRGLIVMYFSRTIIGMISRLETQFTRYHLEKISKFKSKYSIRLYEILVKWLSATKSEKYEIQDLRSKLGVLNSEYVTMSLFKKNVIDKAVNEINEDKLCDIKISYEQFKLGKSISHIQFTVRSKFKPVENKELNYKLSFSQVNTFALKLLNDPSFGSKYGGIGESSDAFLERIGDDLLIESKVKEYAPFLIKHGFVFHAKKSSN